MSTVTVWVLLIYVGGLTHHNPQGGVTVIDNITTEAECERVAREVYRAGQIPFFKGMRCIQVERVRP